VCERERERYGLTREYGRYSAVDTRVSIT